MDSFSQYYLQEFSGRYISKNSASAPYMPMQILTDSNECSKDDFVILASSVSQKIIMGSVGSFDEF